MKMENQLKGLCVVCDKRLPDHIRKQNVCINCKQTCDVRIKSIVESPGPSPDKFGIIDVKSICCNADVVLAQTITCNKDCHEKLVGEFERQFGLVKKVIGSDGVAHVVPTKYIVERGLRESELGKFPLWMDN